MNYGPHKMRDFLQVNQALKYRFGFSSQILLKIVKDGDTSRNLIDNNYILEGTCIHPVYLLCKVDGCCFTSQHPALDTDLYSHIAVNS